MTKRSTPFYPEVRERAVRMVRNHEGGHGSRWSAIPSIAVKIGCSGETLRNWVRQSERDRGVRPGQTTDERERIKALERENLRMRPICRVLPIASSTYYLHAARRADPDKQPVRARSDAALMIEIQRVFEANFCVYGVRKSLLRT